jgi:CheY-like chemotaxis protein
MAAEAVVSSSGDATFAVRCIRALLERHGLRKYRQAPWLAEALGISYSQAHRRLTGTSPWQLEDLQRVAWLFGETLAQLVTLDEGEQVRGMIRVGASSFACQMWLGEAVANPGMETLVAIHTASGWFAAPARDAEPGTLTYKITRLEFKPAQDARRIVAVLDDDRDLTASVCEQLAAAGYDARAYTEIAELQASAKAQKFDGFVIDWIIGDTTALELISTLRAKNARAPIVVLTGQVLEGAVDEFDIAHAIARFGLVFSEKPLRMSILLATLSLAFSAAEERATG